MKRLTLLVLVIFAGVTYLFLRLACEGYKMGPEPNEWGSIAFLVFAGVIYGIATISALIYLVIQILESL